MSVVSENSSRWMSHRLSRNHRNVFHSFSGWETVTPLAISQFSTSSSKNAKASTVDDKWADNTTVITGTTNERSYRGTADGGVVSLAARRTIRRCCRIFWICSASLFYLFTLLSAPIMASIQLVLQQLNSSWPQILWQKDCWILLFDVTIKSLLFLVAVWVFFFRKAAAVMPRLYLQRAALTLFAVFILFAFWLFYVVKVLIEQQNEYKMALEFAGNLLDALLCCHYIAVIVLELRPYRPEFIVHVLRDPDGESQNHLIGVMSIQEAAVYVLHIYNAYFPSYNPYLNKDGEISRFRSAFSVCINFYTGSSHVSSGFKMYDIEGLGDCTISESNARVLMEAALKRRFSGHNERYYAMMEWQKRVMKCKYRLISATEDAFASVQSIIANNQKTKQSIGEPMEALSAAQAVFSVIARPLNKYLKVTRQQPIHTANQVVSHIAQCLTLNFSAATFLQRFFSSRFPLPDCREAIKWSVVCSAQVSTTIKNGTMFVLRSHQRNQNARVQLLCTVHSLSFYNLTEQQSSSSKFAFKIIAKSADG
uniref:Vang-like protein n=1 Tax=Syphacia muris TaxID=451379 RepID=A0A0N5AEX2_9BILA